MYQNGEVRIQRWTNPGFLIPVTIKTKTLTSAKFNQAFGVEQGETTRYEFGAALNAYYKFSIMDNVTMENIANLYSNYLDNPGNVDIDYQMNLVMKIN